MRCEILQKKTFYIITKLTIVKFEFGKVTLLYSYNFALFELALACGCVKYLSLFQGLQITYSHPRECESNEK